MAVIDQINVRKGTTDMPIDSYDNKMIDEIVYEGQKFHFAKSKSVAGVSQVVTDNAVNEPMTFVSMQGNTEQKSYEGYNLFDADTNFTDTKNGVTVTVKDGIIEMSGTSTTSAITAPIKLPNVIDFESNVTYTGKLTVLEGSIGFRAGVYVYTTNPSGYKGNFGVISSGGSVSLSRFTPTEEIVNSGIELRVAFSTGEYNCKLRLEIVKGNYTLTTFPPYEPYVGGKLSPNAEYPQPINSSSNMELVLCGRNQIYQNGAIENKNYLPTCTYDENNQSYTLNGTVTANGNITVSRNIKVTNIPPDRRMRLTRYILGGEVEWGSPIEGAGVQILWALFTTDNKKYVRMYDSEGVFKINPYSVVVTLLEGYDEYNLIFQIYGANTFKDLSIQLMLEPYTETIGDFEPYIEPATVNIPIELNKLGDVADELIVDYSAKTVTLIKRIEKFYLKDQIKNVRIDETWEPGNVAIVTTTIDWKNDESDLCSHCKRYNGDTSILSFDCSNNDIQFYIINQSTPEDFIQWATDNNVQMALMLERAITIDYTSEDWAKELLSLETHKGTNIISITSEVLVTQTNASYWRQIIPNE